MKEELPRKPGCAALLSLPCDLDLRSALRLAGARLLLLLQALHVQGLERYRGEQHRREAAARHEIGVPLPQIGKQDRRAADAEERVEVLRRHVADRENSRLHRLREEHRALAGL